MTQPCKFFVDAGAGWCKAKKDLGHRSLYCAEGNRKNPNCEKEYQEWLAKKKN